MKIFRKDGSIKADPPKNKFKIMTSAKPRVYLRGFLRLAKKCGVAVLGTGVNPGFLMDAWPLFMSGVCTDVKAVRVSRVQDASSRRIPFQEKIGAGKTKAQFRKLVQEGKIRHAGLPESVAISIKGTPNMEVIVKGGTHGDVATVAMLTNAVSKILELPPGLKTMKDLIISSVPNRA